MLCFRGTLENGLPTNYMKPQKPCAGCLALIEEEGLATTLNEIGKGNYCEGNRRSGVGPHAPVEDFGIYTETNEAICSIRARTSEEALEKFRTEDPEGHRYKEGFWAEELDA